MSKIIHNISICPFKPFVTTTVDDYTYNVIGRPIKTITKEVTFSKCCGTTCPWFDEEKEICNRCK